NLWTSFNADPELPASIQPRVTPDRPVVSPDARMGEPQRAAAGILAATRAASDAERNARAMLLAGQEGEVRHRAASRSAALLGWAVSEAPSSSFVRMVRARWL